MNTTQHWRRWLASVERVAENGHHLSVHRGHKLDSSNGHDALDVSAAKQMTFTGTGEELRERLAQLEAPRRHRHYLRDQPLRFGTGAEGLRRDDGLR